MDKRNKMRIPGIIINRFKRDPTDKTRSPRTRIPLMPRNAQAAFSLPKRRVNRNKTFDASPAKPWRAAIPPILTPRLSAAITGYTNIII